MEANQRVEIHNQKKREALGGFEGVIGHRPYPEKQSLRVLRNSAGTAGPSGDRIAPAAHAAGSGRFVDPTPADDREFGRPSAARWPCPG